MNIGASYANNNKMIMEYMLKIKMIFFKFP